MPTYRILYSTGRWRNENTFLADSQLPEFSILPAVGGNQKFFIDSLMTAYVHQECRVGFVVWGGKCSSFYSVFFLYIFLLCCWLVRTIGIFQNALFQFQSS
jgi:hypothetical protein